MCGDCRHRTFPGGKIQATEQPLGDHCTGIRWRHGIRKGQCGSNESGKTSVKAAGAGGSCGSRYAPASSVTVQYPNTGEDRAVGSIVEVHVQYTGNYLTPLTTLFGARTFTIDFRSRRSITDTNAFEPSARCQ